jgi:hypothetical protein
VAQAWVELLSQDPEAFSATQVARDTLAAGRTLASVRRARLFELAGPLPDRAGIEALMHRSIQFYNPHKERCTIRAAVRDASPVGATDVVVLVADRGEERRPAAERWWRHETGDAITVREGVAWILTFDAGDDGVAHAEELAAVRDRRHGLLCNPNAQTSRIAQADIPLPWLGGGES